ncbi:uncharacterized protein Z520_10183 [Fonsecaea multimorphosa CBS 102226]|uniref:Uncharacterized protein n=1 Tax=Fonsecaea multimorphosa CBS 102226 TaxID=1442371 RepID=A0A0D2JLH2_9EURO|nr:uncharacterized protein Z520_10183 [Fonsecaea multimorphosa CBS 102226]KIX94157.1 hypothetical protein Z520_10183 [Fonsecaea multimorphosa CBS 102226]OAL19510.1 hypothetical protein AYO22_09672 [Fonsecaea multimorphosa]
MGAILPSKCELLPQSIDWRGPVVMFLCFLGAITSAIGHHVLNLKLQGRAVAAVSVDQQWIFRAGNALAYLVKVLLVLAASTAYFQRVWHHARGRSMKLSQFDYMFGALDNILELRHLAFWVRRPVLLLAVAIVWLIPLVAIITPGTISVVSASATEPSTISVQQREYGKGSYGAPVIADNGTVFYGGARSYLKGPTLATLFETEILSVGTFPTNLTWSMGFFGPAVSCSTAGAEVTLQLTNIILPYQKRNQTSLMFDAWIPRPAASSNDTLVDGMLVLDPDQNSNLRILDQTSPDAAKIYYSIAPDVATQATMANPIYVIECALYNASWNLDFDVRRTGEQILTPTLKFENWMPGWSSIKPALTASPETSTILDYAGLMETFGAITSGHLDYPNDPLLQYEQTSLALETSPILFNDAFPDPFDDSAMIQLQRTFETLFQNMTLSARYAVLPRDDLRGDASDLTFVKVNATSTFSRNVYSYDSRDLIIAYSLAIGSSAICILLAMLAISSMGAVYSNSFSTAVRASRGQSHLDAVIQDDHDRSGAQPLPKRIADAYIWIGREHTVGTGIGRGRVATEDTLDSQKERRSWWGKEQVMDLEKSSSSAPSNVVVPPDGFVAEPKTNGPLGEWI